MSLNRVTLVGRMVRDPELRTTNTGKNVVEFTVAVDKRIKPQDANAPTADFFRVKAWGQAAEFVSNYGSKGRLCAVDGRLETRKFTDSQGNNREVVEIVADNVNLLDRPKDDGGPTGGGSRSTVGVGAAPSADEYDPFADE